MLSLIHEFLVVRASFIVRDNSSVRNTFQPLMQKAGQRGGTTNRLGPETNARRKWTGAQGLTVTREMAGHRGPPR